MMTETEIRSQLKAIETQIQEAQATLNALSGARQAFLIILGEAVQPESQKDAELVH